ncbi:MAG: Glu-tRNA(Gln) amidotransferase subunit GatD [Thermoplasmata archaeon]|nr:Glu-tRNA(Gln) amidotransferase subunit GatD [Thermoplasmata archaeon]
MENILRNANAEEGDLVEIEVDDEKIKGVLMPHHEFSDKNIIIVKLSNGYNIGIDGRKDIKIRVLEKKKKKAVKKKVIPFDPAKPTVSVIGTGGTIACYVDYRTGAVHPATSAEDLAFSVPEIFDICNVKAKVAFQMLSENLKVSHWQTLAREVANAFNNERVSGVVIPHGTDTMGYTSAALSFMLKNLSGPVVLVGAQRSSDRPSSDAAQNLLSAVTVAAKSDLGEVVVVMHGEISDTFTYIHRGTRVRKMHTSRRDAFKTINEKPLGKIEYGRIELTGGYRGKTSGKVVVDDKMDDDVALVYFYPGMKEQDLPDKKGLVIMGTGLGHISTDLIKRIRELIDNGSVIVMTSQCIFGRVNMRVYSNGRELLKAGVISGEDMLPEVAYVKLMWALAHAKDRNDVARIMHTNIAREISGRTISTTFL